MNDLNAIWSGVVEKLYLQMTNAHFNSWILPLVPLKIDENSIYIKANINLVKKVVSEKYLDSIQKEIREATGKNLEVVILEPRDERVESIMKNLNIEKDGQVSMINPDSQEPLPVIKKYLAPTIP